MTLVGKPHHRPRFDHNLVAAASQIDFTSGTPYKPDAEASSLWELYRSLGDISYIMKYKKNAVSRLTFFPAVRSDPDQDPEPVTEGPALEAYEAVQGPQGEFGDFAGEAIVHLGVVGEGYLVGYTQDSEWDFISGDEYRAASSNSPQKHQDDVRGITGDDFVLRTWYPDPQWRYRAESALKSVRHEAETLILLRNMVQALVRSRLPSKILGIPEELSFPSHNEDTSGVGAEAGDGDPFINELIKAIITSVTDDRSAARFAPLIIRGHGDDLAKITEIDLTRDMPEWILNLTELMVRRLAIGLDMPAEILLGLSDVNHWTAWLVDESAYKQHIDPDVTTILDSWTRGYLWPYLEEAGVANPRDYLFWRDYSELTARTASPDVTLKAAALGSVLSYPAIRKYLGYNEADAPEPGDTPPTSADALPAGPDTQTQGPPPSMVASARPATQLGNIDRRLFTQISEAAQAALDRALERAGSKIVTHARGPSGDKRPPRHKAMMAKISDVPKTRIGVVLGKAAVHETLQLTDDELIPEGTFDAAGDRISQILRRGQDETAAAVAALGGKVERTDQETKWVDRAKAFIVGALTGLALTKLFTPDTRPDPATTGEIGDTAVPAGDVFDAMTLAGGGEPSVDPAQPRGLATGAAAQEWLTAGDVVTEGYEWQVGAPKYPFEPHQNLSGIRFDRWTSAELSTPIAADWLGTPYMFPGDHRGCQCVAVPVVDSAG